MIENTHYATSFPPGVGVILVKIEFLSYMLLRWKLPYTTKQSRGKTRFLLNRESFPIEYFTRLGIHYYKKLLPRKFSRRIFIFVLTVKIFPLDCFVVYGMYTILCHEPQKYCTAPC